MADVHKQDFLGIISCQSVAVLIALIIRAYCEFPAASLSSDSRGPREQRPQRWRALRVLVEIIWGWSCDLEHLKYLSIYCGERYANNTCLPGLISAPNHEGFLRGSFRRPWVTINPDDVQIARRPPAFRSQTPFPVVCHKRVWNALKWQHLGVFFPSSICSLLEL